MQTGNIRPVANSATYNTWTANTGLKPAAVDPLEPIAHDDDTTYISLTSPAITNQGFTLGARPQMYTLSAVKAYVRGKNINNYSASQNLNVFARRGGVDGAPLVLTGLGDAIGNYTTGSGTLPKPGGGVWSVADILDSTLELVVGVSAWAGGVTEYRVTSMWIEVTFTPVPKQTSQARMRGTRKVRMYSKGVGLFEFVGPPDVMNDIELCSFFQVSHKQWPAADGKGAGILPSQRALLAKIREETDPMLDVTKILAYDPRSFLATFYEGGHTDKPANSFGDGVPRFDVGNLRTFKRDSKTWVESNDGYVDELGDDIEKYDRLGLLMENYSENRVQRSSFKSGTTGVTLLNAGGGGQGTVAVDTTALKFRSTVTPNSIKITALNPPQASDLGFRVQTDTITAGTSCSYSIDYLNDTGGTLEVQLLRVADTMYYNPTIPGWQALAYSITLPSSTTWARYMLEKIDIGGADSAVRLFAVQLNGSTANSQIDHVAHVQWEPIAWVTSRILTDGATVSRAIESLKISNNAGKRAWHGQHGTAYTKFFAEFSAGTMNARGGFPNWYTLNHDAGNYWKFLYDGSNGSLARLEVKVAGTVYAAWCPFTPTPWSTTGTWLTIRWTGTQGELGLRPFTLDVFVNGVKGTSVILPALPTEAATSDLYIGGNDVDWAANGAMRYIWFTPRVHSDTEIARRTAA